MRLFDGNELDLDCFDPELITATEGMGTVIAAATATGSPEIESTHFLMALVGIDDGLTRRVFAGRGFAPGQFESGLAACAVCDRESVPPAFISRDCMHASAMRAFEDLAALADEWRLARVTEGALLLAMLRNLTDVARRRLGELVDLPQVIEEVELEAGPTPEHAEVFGPQDRPPEEREAQLDAFSPSGRRVLRIMAREAEALGFDQADARHLLLACLAGPGETLKLALHQQDIPPKRLQEGLMLGLQGPGERAQTTVALRAEDMQTAVRHVIETAADIAARERVEHISEKHIVLAFLTVETLARRLLLDYGFDPGAAVDIIARHEIDEELEPEPGERPADLEAVREQLETAVLGQSEAVNQVFRYVKRMMMGYRVPGRPAGVFLFCGESGTGKTELAKAVARAIYGSEEALVFLEMGQYQTRESMNMLVGAPHGYVGFGEGKLTNALRDDPRRVILFDEFEKAHSEVYNAVLRFLDEGRIEDPAGPVRDGRECIVVLTSNVGAGELAQLWEGVPPGPEGYWEIRQRLRQKLLELEFRPELLNRVDECILFRDLGDQVLTAIADREIGRCVAWLENELGVEVEVARDVADQIGSFCSQSKEGARLAHRVARAVILDPVLDFVLEAAEPELDRVEVRARPGQDGHPYGTVSAASEAPRPGE
ncbi:MAG: AAA family ATPase [Armatimonadota bacterium]|nr:AAA family ATPase [Armatimonadota bacterium]